MSEGEYRIISLEHPDGYAVISGEALVDNQICKGCSKGGAELIAATLNAYAGREPGKEGPYFTSADAAIFLSLRNEITALKAQLAVARDKLEGIDISRTGQCDCELPGGDCALVREALAILRAKPGKE